ncbi:hypothetical protein I7I53_05102 [Histoplasma capsulatum var. duboisii H88]|uniref:Uncharacterized protein n=1 Tax=Ajellomyces capsulatus (strain H88) TaxID=544711 RepID=A0A8A1LWL4_AJEC8|nr:hypothetical protein I7I53_05102 [Histoplasma capsulatum var. duboisii H88]
MMNKLTARKRERTVPHMVMGFDGTEKNIRAISRLPMVKVAKEKSRKPGPRLFIPGGLTKVDASSTIHQIRVIIRKRMLRLRRARTLQRLYGDTCLWFSFENPFFFHYFFIFYFYFYFFWEVTGFRGENWALLLGHRDPSIPLVPATEFVPLAHLFAASFLLLRFHHVLLPRLALHGCVNPIAET